LKNIQEIAVHHIVLADGVMLFIAIVATIAVVGIIIEISRPATKPPAPPAPLPVKEPDAMKLAEPREVIALADMEEAVELRGKLRGLQSDLETLTKAESIFMTFRGNGPHYGYRHDLFELVMPASPELMGIARRHLETEIAGTEAEIRKLGFEP
jgi:hypothetical protein